MRCLTSSTPDAPVPIPIEKYCDRSRPDPSLNLDVYAYGRHAAACGNCNWVSHINFKINLVIHVGRMAATVQLVQLGPGLAGCPVCLT